MVTNIFSDGVLIDIDVSFWSGAKVLKAEDLGLKPEEVVDAYHLGKKMLIPANVLRSFRSIENKARRVVENNSFRFPVSNARFIPNSKYAYVIEKLTQYRERYNRLVDGLIENYQQYREEMLPIYEKAAQTAYINQTPTQHTFGPDYDREQDRADYMTEFLNRIESYYPPAESLRERFSISWSTYEISPSRSTTGTQINEKVNEFIQDVVKVLRQETVEVCNRIVNNISEGKIVKGQTINSLKSFIDKFSALNFVGDGQIETELNKLRTEILDAHSPTEISEDMNIQMELKRKLNSLSDLAGNMTDINSVTGEYKRKISWE